MKKILIAIATVMTSCLVAFADTTLESAYDQLSALPGMCEKNVGKVKIGENTNLRNVRTSSVKVGQDDIQAYRDRFVWMTENLPIKQQVIGANNRRELAAVYATPLPSGDFTVLIFRGNSINGDYSVSYGQTTKQGLAEINTASLEMDNAELIFSAESDDNKFLSVTAY